MPPRISGFPSVQPVVSYRQRAWVKHFRYEIHGLDTMECRRGCGACCIAPSISSPLPGMPLGKPAGVTCVNLEPQTFRCRIWGSSLFPDVCRNFTPSLELCATSRDEALVRIASLELATRP